MYHFSYGESCLSMGLDWVGVGFTGLSKYGRNACNQGPDILQAIKEELGEAQEAKHSFYEQSFRGEGWTFSFQPKKGVKNLPYALEIRGSLFTGGLREEVFNEVFGIFYDGGSLCNPFRVDCRLDIYGKVDPFEISFQSSYMTGKYFYTEEKVCNGFIVGKGDTVYRFYDKKLEQEERGNECKKPYWWRWEVQIRGEVLKKQFAEIPGKFYYSDFFAVGALLLSSRNKIDVNPSWIQTSSGHIVSGEIVKLKRKKGDPEASFRWFSAELEKRTRQFYRSLVRKFPEIIRVSCEKPTSKECEWYSKQKIWEEDEE